MGRREKLEEKLQRVKEIVSRLEYILENIEAYDDYQEYLEFIYKELVESEDNTFGVIVDDFMLKGKREQKNYTTVSQRLSDTKKLAYERYSQARSLENSIEYELLNL